MMRPRPRVLHLFSDWRWTPAAESTVILCRRLRGMGFPVDLACPRAPHGRHKSLERGARERSLDTLPDFRLDGSTRDPFKVAEDIRTLAEFMDRDEVEIVHVHAAYDHYAGSRAAHRVNNRPFVVRTNHGTAPLSSGLLSRFVMRGRTDAWIACSRACLDADVAHFNVPPSRGIVIEDSLDMALFAPQERDSKFRDGLGIGPDMFLAGVIVQSAPGEETKALFSSLAEAARQEPLLRILAIVREAEPFPLRELAARLAIQDRLLLCDARGGDYPDYLRLIDLLALPAACGEADFRAAREAMAAGKPLVAPTGSLPPELAGDGRWGTVAEDSPQGMARAVLRLARNASLRGRLGQGALDAARERFSMDHCVEAVAELYLKLVEKG